MDAAMHFLGTLGYYALNLGWLPVAVAGLAMLFFRRTRWWGPAALSVGVIWVGVFIVIDMKHASDYARVEQNFDRVKVGMSQTEVEELLGQATYGYASGGSYTKGYELTRHCSRPDDRFPFWYVDRRSWRPEVNMAALWILDRGGALTPETYRVHFDTSGAVEAMYRPGEPIIYICPSSMQDEPAVNPPFIEVSEP